MLNISQLQKRILCKLGYQKAIPNGITRENFFDLYFSLKKPFVVQLGANDGKTHDPLHKYIFKYQLPGLLVEPQTDVFERLKGNYKENPNLIFANVAIGERDGEVPFYRIKPELVLEGKEYKASSGSSFYREQIIQNVINRLPPKQKNILKYISSNPYDYVREDKVKVMTLSSLLGSYGIRKIDLYFSDCQGHDYKIIKQLDLSKFIPDIINYEHALLEPDELIASRDFLKINGYKYFISEGDTCAYKISI
jgi:FkbM family methyltransferase